MSRPEPTTTLRLREVALATLAVLLLLPTAAAADRPASFSERSYDAFCPLEGDAFLSLFAIESDEFAFVDVELVTSDVLAFGGTDVATIGPPLVQDLLLFDDLSDDVIAATVNVVDVQAAGPVEAFSDRFREGNRWVEISGSFAPAQITGSVNFGFGGVDLSDCEASIGETEFWSTNPNAFVGRFDNRFLDCFFFGDDVFGSLFLFSEGDGIFGDIFVDTGEAIFVGFDEGGAHLDDDSASATFDLFQVEGEPVPPLGTAQFDATLTSLGERVDEIVFQDGHVKVMIESFLVDGSLTIGGVPVDGIECFAESVSERVRQTSPNGPQAKGKAPANDVPEGAVTLEEGRRLNAQTKGASLLPEAPCAFDFGEPGPEFEHEPEDIPWGRTLWYAVEGTGDWVTVDTAGSDFDTVLAVYDGSMDPIACVDDVFEDSFSLQAAATFYAEAGATYYVQIGGFGFGPRENGAQYGLLRVELR